MEYTNSSLVVYTKLSPNYNKRTGAIKKITIHHMAGNASVETCGNVFATKERAASSNYGIGTDGRIAMYVEEKNRAWTSSNRDNDFQAVTIEVANNSGAPNWTVSDKAMESLIRLCVDICKRNGISKLNFTGDKSGNLTMHKYFTATDCPGKYLESKFPWIAEEVNRRLGVTTDTTSNNSTTDKKKLYRVRKTWEDAKSQKGAFAYLDNAKSCADEYGLIVFDWDGRAIYPEALAIGDKVKLTSDAKYHTGKSVPNWVKAMTLYVREFRTDGYIVVSILRKGAITGAVDRKYLVKQ